MGITDSICSIEKIHMYLIMFHRKFIVYILYNVKFLKKILFDMSNI